MSDVIDRRVYYPGNDIFKEGSFGTEMFVVESGKVEIGKGDGADYKVLGHIGPGGVFGEMALIDSQPRMAHARAVNETVCKVIDKKIFNKNMTKIDPFMRTVIDILTKNVRSLSRRIDELKG